MPFTSSNSSHSISSTKSRRLSLSLSNREIPEPVFANLNASPNDHKNIANEMVNSAKHQPEIQQSIEISRRVLTPESNNEETEEENTSMGEENKENSEGELILDSLNSEKNIENTLNNMLILSESVTSQLKILINDSISDLKNGEFNFFGVFKAIVEKELDLVSSIYIGDAFGNKVGVFYYGGELYMMNSSQSLNSLTFCQDWTSKSECEMGSSKTFSNTELRIENTLVRDNFQSIQIVGLVSERNTVRLLKKWIDSKSNFYYFAMDLSLNRLCAKALVPTMYYSVNGNIMLMDTNSTSVLGAKFDFSSTQIEKIKKSKPTECSQQIIVEDADSIQTLFMKRMCLGERLDLILVTSIPTSSLTSSLVSPMLITLAANLILFIVLAILSITFIWLFLRPLNEIFQMVDETYGIKESFNGVPRKKNLKTPLVRNLHEFKFLREMIGRLVSPQSNNQSFIQKNPIVKYESDLSINKSIDLKSSQQFAKTQNKEGIGSFLSNSFKFANKKRHQQVIEEREVICVGVSLEGLDQVATSNMGEAIHFLLECCEKITTMCSQKGCKAGFLSTNVIGLFYNFATNTFPIDKIISNNYFFLDQLEKIKIKHPIKFRMVTFQQKLLCGLATPTIFTPFNTDHVMETIRKMNDICVELDIKMTVPEYFKKATSEKYYHRFIGNVFLLNSQTSFSNTCLNTEGREEEIYNLYEVGEEKIIQQDQEWMYELHEKTKKHKWDEYNGAHQLFEDSKFEEARDLLNTIINEQTQTGTIDQATFQLYRLCEISINNMRENMNRTEVNDNDNTESSMGTDYL
ncbi:predicted protein [Naegleria gruberi]|uniref:Predicted protein n=1 Tax=Naegleria gruberi TaxID=5762 RepID=D2UZN4_NAEGR|nr:uncharacterized protein NAEGRDRAFT_62003 [Naegleria gruberi]EFC50189.1 predicted protein [Naegleria gruberi]|eukprot:XP_002682933.1 predicted protein [Naegleria gruberi strain NEG-M]